MLRLSKLLNLCIFVASIKHICKEYHKRICTLEGEKIDSEYEVARKALEARIDFLILLLIDPPFWTRARLCLRPPSCLEEIKQIELRHYPHKKNTSKQTQTKQNNGVSPRRSRRHFVCSAAVAACHAWITKALFNTLLLFIIIFFSFSLSSAAIFSHCLSHSLASLSLPLWMLNLK